MEIGFFRVLAKFLGNTPTIESNTKSYPKYYVIEYKDIVDWGVHRDILGTFENLLNAKMFASKIRHHYRGSSIFVIRGTSKEQAFLTQKEFVCGWASPEEKSRICYVRASKGSKKRKKSTYKKRMKPRKRKPRRKEQWATQEEVDELFDPNFGRFD